MALRLRRPVRTAAYAALAVCFAWAFHDRYWQHRDCFNELGRRNDPLTRDVITAGSAFWGVLASIFAPCCLHSLLRRGKST